jgi:hypothetical protein
MLLHNGRRLLVSPERVELIRTALREARADLDEMHARHLAELASLRAEVAELREILALVVSITREQVEADVVSMRRQLETALARIERKPDNTPLH